MKRTIGALVGASIFLASGLAYAAVDSVASASPDAAASTRNTQSRMDVSDPNTTDAVPGSNPSTAGTTASALPSRGAMADRSLQDAPHDYAMKAQSRLDEIDSWISQSRSTASGSPSSIKRIEDRSKNLRSELDKLRMAKSEDWRRSQTRFETAMQALERDFNQAQTRVN